MDRRSAIPEELPPLDLCVLRQLDLEQPSRPGRPAHLPAGSGIVRRGDYIYVIGDDEIHLGVFRGSSSAPGTLRKALSGELPAEESARQQEKPDLEALTVLPPFADHPYGALFGVGSGSGPGRDRGFFWALASDGALAGDPREVDLSPVYGLLRERTDDLNIEGASVMGDRLWLLQRGNSETGVNLVAELSLEQVMQSMQRDLRIDAEELADVRSYQLGDLAGVELTFSDATPLASDLLVFTASAEGSPESYEDDEIHGSVVGTMTLDGEIQRLRTIDRRYKVEGVHATIETGVVDLLFVCDQDDPDEASPLLSATMPLEGRFEYQG